MAQLKKTVGPVTLIAVGAAGIIGSSFLYLASELFALVDLGGTVIGMILATVLASCVALAISELTSAFPRAGGELVFSYVAFNRGIGFIVGWLLIIIFTGIVAFYVTAAGFLLGTVIPEMNTIPLYSVAGETVYLPVLATGVVLLLIMLGLNWFGASMSFKLQLGLFIAMVVTGLVVVGVGFGAGSIDNFLPMFSSPDAGEALLKSLMFTLPALGFLTGFSIVAVMAEEAKVPARRIGIIVTIAVVIAGAFYTAIFAATGYILPWQQVAALDSGTIDAFRVAGYPAVAWAAFAIGVLGIITTFIAVFASVSRLIFSLARVGLMPAVFARVDERTGAPRPALLFTAAVGLGIGWIGPGALTWFLDLGGLNVAIVWIFTVAAFYRIRRRYPDLHRPYRVRWPWVPAIGAVAGVLLIAVSIIPGTGVNLIWPAEYLLLFALWGLGAVLWFGTPKRMSAEESLQGLLGEFYESVRPAPAAPVAPVDQP